MKIRDSSVVLIYRANSCDRFSIEKVFNSLWLHLDDRILIDRYTLPLSGASPIVLIRNLMAVRKFSGLRHVTGDVYYVGIFGGRRTILTIHDVGSLTSTSLFKRLYVRIFWLWLPCLLSKYVTVISEFSKQELIKLAPFVSKKVKVIPNPVNPNYNYKPKESISTTPIILCVGTKSNKNLERVIESVKGINCLLHIIGRLSPEQKAFLMEYNVEYINNYSITEDEIFNAYTNCDLVCFVSTYEGFGMPIIEAQSIGRPVITSNLGAMKEVAESSACMVNPFSTISIRAGINKVINDDAYRQKLVEQGQINVQRFSVAHVANEYMELYRKLYRY